MKQRKKWNVKRLRFVNDVFGSNIIKGSKKIFQKFQKKHFFVEAQNRDKNGFFHFQNKPLKSRDTKNL